MGATLSTAYARVWPHGHVNALEGPLDVKIGVTSQPKSLQGWNSKNKPIFSIEQPTPEESNLTLLQILFLRHGKSPVSGVFHKANVWGLREVPFPKQNAGIDQLSDSEVEAAGEKWREMKPSHITIHLRGRYVDTLRHPVPRGKWEGTVKEDDDHRWALFTLQAVTLAVKPTEQKRHILLPGDPDFDATTEYQKLNP